MIGRGFGSARLIVDLNQDREFTMLLLTVSPKFPLGQIFVTANVREQLSPLEIETALRRHASGDWGTVCADDAVRNDRALTGEGRLFSVYETATQKFWLITEWDRSVTTILMPEDY